MRSEIILDCCTYEVKTTTKLYDYIDCYELEEGNKFFKVKTPDGREIRKELMFVSVCPICGHSILKFLWYTKKNKAYTSWDFTKIVRGKKADEIFERRLSMYKEKNIPNPFLPKEGEKQSKKIPWIYGKSIDGFSQVPRYIDESEDAGMRINCPLKIEKL